MLKRVELYLKDVIYGRKKGFFPFLIKCLLRPLSWLFKFSVKLKNYMYDKGLLRRYVPPIPLVISVGNIVAGGTGKTPVTVMLANLFYPEHLIAILSRGYRSPIERLSTPTVLCRGEGPLLNAYKCGDEPYLFAQRFPKAYVIVGGNRQKASSIAAHEGVQVILLDDAMQHRSLARDVEVVVIDVADPFGQGYFLPRGFLREEMGALSRADLVIINHVTNSDEFNTMKKKLTRYTKAPMIGTLSKVAAVLDLDGKEVGSLSGVAVGMFCGIAHPEYFKDTVKSLGAKVLVEYWLPDHEGFKEKEFNSFVDNCMRKGVKWLICTEKDYVKLKDRPFKTSIPIAWVKMELTVTEEEPEWKQFVERTLKKL